MSLLNSAFISKEHEEFVERYGEKFLDEKIDDFCLEIPTRFSPGGTPYQEDTQFSIEYEDEENNLYWTIEFYSDIGEFHFERFTKTNLH